MNIIKYLKETIPSMYRIKKAICEDRQRLFDIRSEMLWENVYHCTSVGISHEQLCEQEVIVSLTTFGKRIHDVALTIESIMQGSIRPNRIILWLDYSFEGKQLPISLQRQIDRGLEICYCDDLRSYKKLIPTLKKYPEAVIITIDDDLIYVRDLVENLLCSYKEQPDMIHACRMHRITFKKDGSLDYYLKWQWQVNDDENTPLNFFTSGAGTLFPPHCLDNEVFDQNVFLDICKYADDVWFNAMALKKGTLVKKVFTHDNKGRDYIENMSVQDVGLLNINYANTKSNQPSMNDIQFKAVLEKYNLYSKLLVHK